MHRLGPALILLGIILLASPLYLGQSTIFLINPSDVWNLPVKPGGTPSSPEIVPTSQGNIAFSGMFTKAGSGWEIPGTCSGNYRVKASVYDGSALKALIVWQIGEIQATPFQTCTIPEKTISQATLSTNTVYTVKWQLEVRDDSGNVIGTIDKPQDTAFILLNFPTVKWYVNDMEAKSTSSTFVVTPPVRFKMAVVSGDPSLIQAVKVKIQRDTTTLATLTLSKTSTNTWEVTWNTSEKGKLTATGTMTVNNQDYVGLSILLDMGGEGGGGISGLTPLQMIGAVTLLAGIASMVVRRER